MKPKNLTRLFLTSSLFCALHNGAQAQLTWDPDADQVNNGGAGTWDTTSLNWDDDSSAPNVAWTNGSNATFGSGTYQVALTSSGVTVGDLTYGGGGVLGFRGSTASGSPADLITVNAGGATWNTGGGQIEFVNNGNNNNTRLALSSGDTLTVNGGGEFDTGQNPQNNANGSWAVSGASLDITQGTIVRGNPASIGQFATVKLAGGSTYVHERNANQAYNNDWEFDGGNVTFSNRWPNNGHTTINGQFSGNLERLSIDMGSNSRIFILKQAANYTADETRVVQGQLRIDTDNGLAKSLLSLGGTAGLNSFFNMNGNDQEITGLRQLTGNTREVRNNAGSTTATLTIDVANGESYAYSSNFNGGGTIDIVKSGDGTQTFARNGSYTSALGNVSVTGGNLVWNNNNGSTISGSMTVGAAGTLGGSGIMGDLHFDDGGKLDVGLGTITLLSTATLTFDGFDFDDLVNSTWNTDGVGVYTLIDGDFTLDETNVAHFGEANALDRGDGFQVWFIEGSFGYEVGVVPEPSALLLSSLAALGLLGRRSRS